MGMNNVIGHNSAKQTLSGSVKSGRISHAYIFEGPFGVGRLSLAKEFARELAGCKEKFTADNHPDIIVVTNELYNPSKQSKSVLVDTIRAMKTDIYIKPYASGKKVYMIPNADTMQEPAQNSLLKVFEEPPEYCTIILIAENANSLLQTIRSRAQLIRLNPLSQKEVADYLINGGIADKSRAETLAVLSGGSIGRALALTEDNETIEQRERVLNHLTRLCGSGFVPLYDFIKYLKQNKADIGFILGIMSDWSRDVLNIKLGITGSDNILNADKTEQLQSFCSAITKKAAVNMNEIIPKYTLAINRNANYPIAVQCMATEYWEEIHGRSYRSAF